MQSYSFTKTNPFIIFWLGLLTGALLVGLFFMYKQTHNLQDSLTPGQIQNTRQVKQYSVSPQPEIQSKTTTSTAPNTQPLAPNPIPIKGY